MTDLELYNDFAEVACLNKLYDPWRQRRKPDMELATFEVLFTSEDLHTGDYKAMAFWWDKFVGVEFLGLIRWDTWHFEEYGVKKIKEVQVVAMVKNVYMNSGRTISPEYITMV